MLQSRKIVSVKTVSDNEGVVYVQAMTKKSYGTEVRPAVLLFNGLTQRRDTAVVQLVLSCTEQLQKWHR